MNWKRGLIRASVAIPAIGGWTFWVIIVLAHPYCLKLIEWEQWLTDDYPQPIKTTIMCLMLTPILIVVLLVSAWLLSWVMRGFADEKTTKINN